MWSNLAQSGFEAINDGGNGADVVGKREEHQFLVDKIRVGDGTLRVILLDECLFDV